MVGLRTLLVTAIAFTAVTGTANAGERIGSAAMVKNKVVGTHAGRSRDLRVGNGVFEREAIATAERSATQLQFRDQTNLTVGQKSRVVLDRFVYDPRRGTSDKLLSATKGSLRFLSGTAKRKSTKIKIPGATIGIRG